MIKFVAGYLWQRYDKVAKEVVIKYIITLFWPSRKVSLQ